MDPFGSHIDAHLHLQDEQFGTDLAAAVQRAHAAGVVAFCCNGTSPADWRQVLELSQDIPGLIPFVGLHPWGADKYTNNWQAQFEQILETTPCGVGEIGMDFVKPIDKCRQIEAFATQLMLANKFNRPVSIHCVKAWGELFAALRKHKPAQGFMLHAYNGSAELAHDLVKLGAYVSFNALSFTQNRREKTLKLLVSIPGDRVLFETESPHGLNAAVDFIDLKSDMRNEPANLPAIIRAAATLIGTNLTSYANTIYENTKRFLQPLKEQKI